MVMNNYNFYFKFNASVISIESFFNAVGRLFTVFHFPDVWCVVGRVINHLQHLISFYFYLMTVAEEELFSHK